MKIPLANKVVVVEAAVVLLHLSVLLFSLKLFIFLSKLLRFCACIACAHSYYCNFDRIFTKKNN